MNNEAIEGEIVTPNDSTMKTHNKKFVKSSEKNKPTFRQMKFAKAYKEGNTMGNATKSAMKAGYSEHTAHVQGSVLLKNPKVLMILNDAVEEAEEVIKGLMYDESPAIRLAASKEVLDRTVGRAIQRSESVRINVTVESMLNDPSE